MTLEWTYDAGPDAEDAAATAAGDDAAGEDPDAEVYFVILWQKDKGWILLGKTEAAAAPGRYRYRDELPTSGTSRYAVRTFNPDDGRKSPPSNEAEVTIPAPAAGDV